MVWNCNTIKATLHWVPGYRCIQENKQINGLAKQGSTLDSPSMSAVNVSSVSIVTTYGEGLTRYVKGSDITTLS